MRFLEKLNDYQEIFVHGLNGKVLLTKVTGLFFFFFSNILIEGVIVEKILNSSMNNHVIFVVHK